jgi:ABC-2 type transport system ATP-binding protein
MVGDSSPAIATTSLSKRYRGVVALEDLTMTVPRGEVFGFLGPNGAGKTTAVKLLLGLTHPTAGHGTVLGAPLGDRETRRRIGYLPELFRYQEWLSAREVLNVHCALTGILLRQRPPLIDEALTLVGLRDRAADRVGTFSKGMQQRLGLSVALVGTPDLVLLDEPTSALDPVGRHDVRAIMHALKQRGVTVFLNSHLLTEVEHVCDRVAVIHRGRVVALGTLEALLGGSGVVRLRAGGDGVEETLAAFGPAEQEAGWYTLQHLPEEQIPALVAALVQRGCRVYAVEPQRQTLEERFLQLLKGNGDAADHDRPAHPL